MHRCEHKSFYHDHSSGTGTIVLIDGDCEEMNIGDELFIIRWGGGGWGRGRGGGGGGGRRGLDLVHFHLSSPKFI